MGYYSDVRFVTSIKGYKLLKEQESLCYLMKDRDIARINKVEDYVLLGWDDIKWHDGNYYVRDFMSSFDKLKARGIPYKYLRLGEDVGDIEENFFDTDWRFPDLYVKQVIKIWPESNENEEELKFLETWGDAITEKPA